MTSCKNGKQKYKKGKIKMTKPIKLGMVGLGRAGYGMHLKEMKGKEELFQIVAACDLKPERTKLMEEQFGCKAYTCMEELVEDPEVEVVDIATRSCDHYRHAKTALEAGKIVFLEKPMTETVEEAEKLVALAESYGKNRLFIRHNRRFEPRFMQINKIIESGLLGDVFAIRRAVCQYDLRADWQPISQYGGGQLLNWGPHLVDQAIQFCGGDYTAMQSVTRKTVAAGDAEDYIHAIFKGINGRSVEIEISGGSALAMPAHAVFGTRGALIDNGPNFTLRYLPQDYELPKKVANPKTPLDASFHPGDPLPFIEEEREWDTNDLDHTWTYLYEAIRNGKEYPIKNEEAVKIMKALTEIREQNK